MPFIIHKATDTSREPYVGPACGFAHVEPGKVYSDSISALLDAAALSSFAGQSFVIAEVDDLALAYEEEFLSVEVYSDSFDSEPSSEFSCGTCEYWSTHHARSFGVCGLISSENSSATAYTHSPLMTRAQFYCNQWSEIDLGNRELPEVILGSFDEGDPDDDEDI